jgi:multidrug efflux system membrane fusion protein
MTRANRSSPKLLSAKIACLNPCNPWQVVVVAVAVVVLASACTKAAAPVKPPVTVSVAIAERGDAPYIVHANGLVEPAQTVAVQSQVGGVLMKVHFKEGDEVRAGQVLFEIDPRPFKAALDQAVAVLARDEANQQSAQRDADRYAALVLKDFVTKSQADQAFAAAAAAKAVVSADRASMDNAKFNLENATITAPITGKTGVLLVKQGNLVRPGSVPPLVVINQIHPIDVHFTVPDRELPLVQQYSEGGAKKLRVVATPRGIASAEEGVLNMLDNGVDTTTGTVTLKAQFANKEGHLWPGQFVGVDIELYVQQGAVLVPTTAVQTGQDGQFVFVVTGDNKAEVHPVTSGIVVGERTTIEKGIAVGSTVVTDGQLKLTPGAKIEIAKPASKPAATSPAPDTSTRLDSRPDAKPESRPTGKATAKVAPRGGGAP